MVSWLHGILILLSQNLVEYIVPANGDDWQKVSEWTSHEGIAQFTATSSTIGKICEQSSESELALPVVLQGVHEVYYDGKLTFASGDSTFSEGSRLYARGDVSCKELAGAKEIKWIVYNSTHMYAKIFSWPQVTISKPLHAFLSSTLLIACAGCLLILGLFCQIVFGRILDFHITLNLLGACLGFAFFQIMSVPDHFGIEMPGLDLHRLRDAITWIATLFMWNLYSYFALLPRYLKYMHVCLTLFGVSIIAFSTDLDQSQIGSTICLSSNMVMGLTVAGFIFYYILQQRKSGFEWFILFNVSVTMFTGINEILANSGLIPAYPFFSIGSVFILLTFCLAANQKAVEIYNERDHLRENLQFEVSQKTKSLQHKSDDLENALKNLKNVQAELLQNAKLASLGTLSAGIAHEINNSLNYPTGAVKILKRILEKPNFDDKMRAQACEIVSTMEQGLRLTAEIIKNLKSYASGSTEINELTPLSELVNGVVMLFRNKLDDSIKMLIDIPKDLGVPISKTALAQIFMNLIGNAIDAINGKSEGEKQIGIVARLSDEKVCEIEITDSGCGIPPAVIERIYDPFFTTKGEGKGTGLGLHIVHSEVRRAGGKVSVKSEQGVGSKFIISIPIEFKKLKEATV